MFRLRKFIVVLVLATLPLNPLFADQSSAHIGPKKNYRCVVTDGGSVRLLKKDRRGSFRPVSLRLEIDTLFSKQSYSHPSIELSKTIKALATCDMRAKRSVSACNVVRGAQAIVTKIAKGRLCRSRSSAVVLLQLTDQAFRDQGECSGTVIDAHTIVSAAHCFSEGATSAIAYVNGDSYSTSRVFVNPYYDDNSSELEDHDVSVLKFDAILPVRPIRLLKGSTLTGELAIIAGYGDNESGNAERLRSAATFVARTYVNAVATRFKASGTTGNTCEGDSGGPLLVKRGSNWYLAGITSNGKDVECGQNDFSLYAAAWSSINSAFIRSHL